MGERPEVPEVLLRRLRAVLHALPEVHEERAWVGLRWRVGQSTIAHTFGGEDGVIRITFRGEPDDVLAFQHMGERYFKAGWGDNVLGMILDDRTDWQEVTEMLTDSYCLQAPARLVKLVDRPA